MAPSSAHTINSTIVRYINLRTISYFFSRMTMRVASVLAPRLAVKHALDQFLTPPHFPRPTAEQRLLETGTAFSVNTPHGRIAAWRFSGPDPDITTSINLTDRPLILMSHGWGGRGAQFRNFVPALLHAGYQVVLFDHVGHGNSESHDSSLVAFQQGLEAVQQQLQRDGTPVFGMVSHSLGAAAVGSALRSARHVAPLAERVVMIAPPSSLIAYSSLFARYLGITERIRYAMQWRVEQRYGVSWDTFELPHSVNKILTPALVIHDRDDRMVRIESGLAVARAWPDARFHETHGLGHQQILRHHSVVQTVINFLGDDIEFQRPPPAGGENQGEKIQL